MSGEVARPKCTVNGCEKPRKKNDSRYCSMHRARVVRHGDPNFKMRDGSARTIASNGYVKVTRKGHPLLPPSSRGSIWEHRVVLYDKIGPGEHPCHWCGETVVWMARGKKMLTVDHLDEVPTNNDPANLVPSCGPCNASRATLGEIRRFIPTQEDLTDDIRIGQVWTYRYVRYGRVRQFRVTSIVNHKGVDYAEVEPVDWSAKKASRIRLDMLHETSHKYRRIA